MGIGPGAVFGLFSNAIGGMMANSRAEKALREQRRQEQRYQMQMNSIKARRETLTNPYSSTKDLSGLAEDLSSQLTNPYNNIGVATKAAEIKVEQSDIALANTLDTIRATGASAGGATALAQAALQAKKGVASTIEMQEVQNEQLKAKGEQDLQRQKISEQQRLQTVAISEGQRVQQAEAAGKQFMTQIEEDRINADLDNATAMYTQRLATQAAANEAKASAASGILGNLTSMATSGAFDGLFKGGGDGNE